MRTPALIDFVVDHLEYSRTAARLRRERDSRVEQGSLRHQGSGLIHHRSRLDDVHITDLLQGEGSWQSAPLIGEQNLLNDRRRIVGIEQSAVEEL